MDILLDTRSQLLLKQAQQFVIKKDFATASNYAKKILKKHPSNLAANEIILQSALINQDFNLLEKSANIILQQDPNHHLALTAHLSYLELKEHYFDAITTIDKLLVPTPTDFTLIYKKALNSIAAGKILIAEQLLLECEDAGLDKAFLFLNLGHVYKAKGESTLAVKYYQQFIKHNPNNSGIGYWSLADLKDQKFTQVDCEKLTTLTTNETRSTNKALLLFALSRAFEHNNNNSAAFNAMAEANHILAHARPFKAEPYAKLIKGFISGLVKVNNEKLVTTDVTPIFIVGMPRSGTTLVEQILASYGQVETTDELPYMERIALELEMNGGYVANVKNLSAEKAEVYAQQYLAQAGNYLSKAPQYFIDKNPNNFLHIALIKRLFPNAKIINVIRDPLDNALSVFKQHFSNGHDYSYSLPGIVFYWQGYLSLMFHWQKLFANDIYHLSYESLVESPEQQVQQLVEYCGLNFDKQCLSFYKSERVVLTPSVSQVKQPINNKSVGSWQKYQNELQPLLPEFSKIRLKVNELLATQVNNNTQ